MMETRRGGLRGFGLLALGLVWMVASYPAAAKTLLKDVEPSRNTVSIRTDGLACYFCAYGLERFFKKTGRIAAFDMDMQEGIVDATLVRGQPLVSARQLERYVHDAGFTARWIEVTFIGRFRRVDGGLTFEVAESGEELPVRPADAEGTAVAEADVDRLVEVRARGLPHDEAPFELVVTSYQPVDEAAPQNHP